MYAPPTWIHRLNSFSLIQFAYSRKNVRVPLFDLGVSLTSPQGLTYPPPLPPLPSQLHIASLKPSLVPQ